MDQGHKITNNGFCAMGYELGVMSSYPSGWVQIPGVNAMNGTHLTNYRGIQCVCVIANKLLHDHI
jgi:hypothetical protein